MLYRYLIPIHLFILGIVLPLFFFYPNFNNYNQMQLSESQVACIQSIKELDTQLEKFQESYLQSGIAAKTTLTIEEQERADKYEKVKELSQALSTVLGNPVAAFQGINKNAADKPQEAEGVSLKKKEDIGKKTFVDEILAWATATIVELGKLEKDDTPILVKNCREKLSTSLQLAHVINKSIYNGLCKALPDTLVPATRAKASAEMIKLLSSFTKNNLEKLFKDNKDIRKDLADDKSLKPNILPTPSTLYDVLMLPGVEDENHADHPKKKTEAEKAKAEAEKAKAEAEKESNIRKWLQEEYNNLKAASFDDDAITACDTFRENLAIALGTNVIQSLFCEGINEKEQNTNEVKNILLTTLSGFLAQKKLSEVFEKDAAHVREFKERNKIITTLQTNQKFTKGANLEAFIAAFGKWQVKREAMFEQTDKKWKVDKAQLKKELSAVFIGESAFLYNDLLGPMLDKVDGSVLPLNKKLFKEKSAMDFAEIWEGMFAKCNETYLGTAYLKLKKMGKTDIELRNYISVLDMKFPDYSVIWTALETSRFLDPKIKVPTTTKGLSAQIILTLPDAPTKGFVGLNVDMPLKFKPFGLDEKITFHAIVVAEGVSIKQDSSGCFSFSNPSVKVLNIKSEKGIGVTYTVEVELLVTDSSQTLTGDVKESGGVDVSVSVGPVGVDPNLSSDAPIEGKISGTGGVFTLYVNLDIKSEQAVNPDNINVFCYNAALGAENHGLTINAKDIKDKTRLELKYK